MRSHVVSDWVLLRQRFEDVPGRTIWSYWLVRTGPGRIGVERYVLDIGLDSPRALYRRQTLPLHRRLRTPFHFDDRRSPFQDAVPGQFALDEIVITSPKIPETNGQQLRVWAEGTISLNLLDRVHVAGLTPSELDARLKAMMSEYYDNPDIRAAVVASNKPFAVSRTTEHSIAGVRLQRTTVGAVMRGPKGEGFGVVVPFWLLALLAFLPAFWWWLLRRRRERRRAGGLCADCGYDLRATPGRCPECGAVAAAGLKTEAR